MIASLLWTLLALHGVFGGFITECENGEIDIGKTLKLHTETEFPSISEKASEETAIIYAAAIRLVRTRRDKNELEATTGNIKKYLANCNDIFKSFEEVLQDSVDLINKEMALMNVDEKCIRVDKHGDKFKDIAHSEHVAGHLSLGHCQQTFAGLINGAAKALTSIINLFSCILQGCANGIPGIIQKSFLGIAGITKTLVEDVLDTLQTSLQGLFGAKFERLECKPDAAFKENCVKMYEEITKVQKRIDRELNQYVRCLEEKTAVAKKVKNFKSMQRLLQG